MFSRMIGGALAAAILCAVAPFVTAAQPAPPIAAYGELPAIQDASVSRSGAFVAMLMTVNNQRQVMVLDRSGEPLKQFLVGDEKVRGIDWIGDEAILLRRTETELLGNRHGGEKQEWTRANVIPLDDRNPVVSVFADQNYIANAVLGFHGLRQVGGNWFGYFGGFRMGKSSGEGNRIIDVNRALFAVDLRTGKTDLVAHPAVAGRYRDWLVGDDGEVAATFEIEFREGKWSIENSAGKVIARGVQSTGSVDLTGFGASGDTIIYSWYDEDKGKRYFEMPLAGGEEREIWTDHLIHRILFGENARIVGTISKSGKIRAEDAEMRQALEKVYALYPKSHVSIAGWTPDFGTLLFNTSGNYDSGTWYRMDAAKGERSVLGLERPFIQGPTIGRIETIEYAAQDGLGIEAILTLPGDRVAENLPAIILPHGGPIAHDEPIFDWWAQAFAARGYAVLQPNFRGSTNRDDQFRAAGEGEWGGKMQTDLSDGLAALAARGVVDADRTCIVGASYGGYAALAGVTLQNGIYRCAVGVNGVYDLYKFFRDSFTGRSDIFQRDAESLLGKQVDRKDLSPTSHARKADAPVLLIHGKDDTVVPYAQSVLMEDALDDAGKDVRLVSLPGEDHWLSQADTRTEMLEAAIAFVEQHNPPD